MKGLYEILIEKKWMVSPDFVHGIRKALEQNLNTHAAFSKPEKTCGFVTAVAADGTVYYPEEYQISEDGKQVKGNWALDYEKEQNFPFVSVLTIDGPITRNGGGCSYGSVDHRDMMIRAANHPLCCGHVFIINTPGGSAWAKNDYQQAIEYARSKGQPVIAFVDGMCASAGMYLASFCDERYYMHPKNQIGCIGVMAAFYTEADGSTNQFTNETYHELYDPESFDKNREYRDIANDGDTEKLVQELADLGVEFRADVKAACPRATDEHLHGKVFNAEDVEGILVDGQSDFMSVIQRAFALHNGTEQAIYRNNTDEEPAPQNVPEPQDEPEPDDDPEPEDEPDDNTNHTKTSINMANYPLINAACGMKEGEIKTTEEGTFMNAPLLDALEAHLNDNKQQVTDAQQKVTTAENALAELQGKFDELSAQLTAANAAKEDAEKALADANEAHSNELETLNTAHTEALAKKDEEIASLTEAKGQVETELAGAKEALATAEQKLNDKDAQIDQLTNEPSEEQNTGDAPANNGEGAKVQTLREFDPTPYKTNAERKAAFERFKRGDA